MRKNSIAAAAAVTAFVLAAGTVMPLPAARVFAEQSAAVSAPTSDTDSNKDANVMEELLKTVKLRLNIPEEYSDFTYEKGAYNGVDNYTFRWKKEKETGESSNESISVTVMKGGIITRYRLNDGSDLWSSKPTFAKIPSDKLTEYAQNAFAMLNPDLTGKVKFDENANIVELNSSNVTVQFKREENGLILAQNSGQVSIDKNTGKLKSFNMTWWDGAEFEDPSNAVTSEALKKSYKENVKLSPYYAINSDYDEKTGEYKKSAVLLYSPESDTKFDASTGKPTKMYDDYALAYNTSHYGYDGGYYAAEPAYDMEGSVDTVPAGAALSDKDSLSFSEAEKKALMDSGKYYSKDDIVKLLKKDKYLKLTDDYVLNSSSFKKDVDSPSGYSWTMNFFVNTSKEYKSLYLKADAESGKLLYFDKYGNTPQKVINIKTVNKIAEAAAKYYLSDIFGEFKPSESNTADAEKATSRNVIFNRYANDIIVKGNDISINVNSDGEVMGFSYRYDDISLPKADIITVDKAYEKAFEQIEFDLYYDGFLRLNGEPRTYLLYSTDKFYLNAKTGKICTSRGEPVIPDKKSSGCPYTDISDHWAEKYITTLYDYDVRLTGDETEFRPNDTITEAEFAELLDSLFYSNIMPLMYEDYSYENRGSYGKKNLTKAMSAKMFVLSAGGKQFAELKNIYVSPFKDVPKDRDDLGYIAIAYGMGAVKADADGKFNPDGKVSRAYAMYLIYNYIRHCQ